MVKSCELAVGHPADCQSQERTIGCLAQGMGCGELGKQGGEEGKSRRTREDKQQYQRVERKRVKRRGTSAGPGSLCKASGR